MLYVYTVSHVWYSVYLRRSLPKVTLRTVCTSATLVVHCKLQPMIITQCDSKSKQFASGPGASAGINAAACVCQLQMLQLHKGPTQSSSSHSQSPITIGRLLTTPHCESALRIRITNLHVLKKVVYEPTARTRRAPFISLHGGHGPETPHETTQTFCPHNRFRACRLHSTRSLLRHPCKFPRFPDLADIHHTSLQPSPSAACFGCNPRPQHFLTLLSHLLCHTTNHGFALIPHSWP